MFEVGNRASYSQVPNWHAAVQQACGKETPVALLCVSEATKEQRARFQKPFSRKKYLNYFEASKQELLWGFEKPYLWFLRKLSGDIHLHFVEAPWHEDSRDEEEIEGAAGEEQLAKNMGNLTVEEDVPMPSWVTVHSN